MKIKAEVEIELTIESAAAWFASLGDDDQARFFQAVAEIAEKWPLPADVQWLSIGKRLSEIEFEKARDVVVSIAARIMEGSR